MKKYDLIVAGGGFTGSAAAVAAARQGMRVLLIEASNCLGGAAVNSLVNPYMPYHTHRDGEELVLTRGIFSEINARLGEMGAEKNAVFKEEYLKLVLNRLVIGAGVQLLFRCPIIGVDAVAGRVHSVTVHTKSGPMTLEADYFIDATGDADVSVMAGASTRLGREADGLCQPMTLCFRMMGVDLEKFAAERHAINPLWKKYREEGKIKNIREDVLIFSTLQDGMLHFNSTRIVRRNPVDPFDVTAAEIEAREQVFELHAFLKENFSAFAHSDVIMTAPQIGVRESRMIDGEYIMTGRDIMACTKFEDGICAGNYDIDIHNPEGTGTSHYWIPVGEYYTIPYRCLIPRGFVNLLTAGRCISVDHEAQASVRIMPICCSMGEAAGIAAGVAWESGADYPAADVGEIRRRITEAGGFVG